MGVRENDSLSGLVAAVRYIGAVGPEVRLELQREDTGNALDAERRQQIARDLHVFAKE